MNVRKPPSVLLIDDEAELATSLQELFAVNGITLDVANTWSDGLALFRIGHHELVIADYNIPDSRNGLQLLSEIKPLRPSSRLILISGVLDTVPNASELIEGTKLVDRFLRKDRMLGQLLLAEGVDAETRAHAGTHWPTVATAYLDQRHVDPAEVARIDELLRREVG